MKQKAYRQNPTVIDLSKKARPPPGATTLKYMTCQSIEILLTLPLRSSATSGRAHFVYFNLFLKGATKSHLPNGYGAKGAERTNL